MSQTFTSILRGTAEWPLSKYGHQMTDMLNSSVYVYVYVHVYVQVTQEQVSV